MARLSIDPAIFDRLGYPVPIIQSVPTQQSSSASAAGSRHNQWWYPKRCELPGCEARGDGLLKCSACNMVLYCCKEHQREDWPEHKSDCAVFRRLGLSAIFYTDELMLQRYPLTPNLKFNNRGGGRGRSARGGSRPAPIPADALCELCSKTQADVPLTRTDCCGQVVCNNSHEYQLMSYSREYCQRSHDRYTLCGYHGEESHCDRSVDWRQCRACTGQVARGVQPPKQKDVADRLWRGLNAYNYCPLLEKDVPRHSLCEVCDRCGRKFIGGVEGSAYMSGQNMCVTCSNRR